MADENGICFNNFDAAFYVMLVKVVVVPDTYFWGRFIFVWDERT